MSASKLPDWCLPLAEQATAQLTIIRRVLGRLLPGGEAEFWRLLEEELSK